MLAQPPNAALWIFLVANTIGWVAGGGAVGRTADVVARLALVWWAIDEVVRGVNPFRRMLGGVALALLGLLAVGTLLS